MGTNSNIDYLALKEAREIPDVCKQYLSHHIRNELTAMLGVLELRLKNSPDIYRRIKEGINHIVIDISKLGI